MMRKEVFFVILSALLASIQAPPGLCHFLSFSVFIGSDSNQINGELSPVTANRLPRLYKHR